MSGYIGPSPVPQATQHREAFTATASQTSFPTVGYTPQFVDVYLNGVKLAAADYTATNGSDIVLTTGAALNDILEYVAYTPFEVASQTFTGTTTTDVLTTTGAFTSLGIDDNATSVAITIDASENVGIGTASPTGSLDVARSGSHEVVFRTTSTGDPTLNLQADGTNNGKISYVRATEGLTFSNGGSERLRIDASGNVGIGTAAPAENLHISSGFPAIKLDNTDAGGHSWRIASGDTGSGFAGNLQVYNEDTATVAMMIESSSRTWIGGSTMPAGITGLKLNVIGGSNDLMASYSTSVDAKTHWLFNNPNGNVGTIRTSASTTSYNTTSDHRLKENITAIQGAADIVKAMRPCTYTFKADGDWADGFIAHELQELHPVAVSGEKDAMRDEEYEVTPAVLDEDGAVVTEAVMGTRSVPDYQGVDYSKLTPILTAALKEALTKIEVLEAQNAAFETRLTALEATP